MYVRDNAIDISGVPGDDLFVGLVSFNPYYRLEIIKKFYDKFPELKHSRWKGTKLGPKKLLQIVSFLSEEKVKMYAIKFLKKDWNFYRNYFLGTKCFEERIYAILIYKLIKKSCWRGAVDRVQYNFTLDEETNLDMGYVLTTCQKLCKAGRINVMFTTGRAKFYPLIKFADYVAAAYRKVNTKNLEKIENLKIVNNQLTPRELGKAFRLDKKSKKKIINK
jgi:hypothetical protein